MPTATPVHTLPFCEPAMLYKGLGITVAVNAGIALMLWRLGLGSLDEQMVYSQGIGLSIWALTNAGARWLSRPGDSGGFPRGWRAAVLVLTGVGLGATIGMMLGNLYAGRPGQLLISTHPRLAWTMMAMTFVVGGAMTLYFYLTGKSTYLQSELERTQRQTAEAQLKLLESQLEPHMLFNTLANLRVLIGLDPLRAQAMLDHLIAYLRATLAASREPGHSASHTLTTEFARLNDYLALMTIRMGPRLRVTLDLHAELRDLPIPPLLLQPLVENAIQHGLEPKVAGGHIVVRASLTRGLPGSPKTDTPAGGLAQPGTRTFADPHDVQTLCLEVTDDGVGTAADLPTALTCTGFGTTQVRERLATVYGNRATLEWIANNPCGISARVTIRL